MRVDMEAHGETWSDIASRVERSLRRIREAPVSLLLCREATAVRGAEPEEISMAVQSVAAAGLQLLLAAHAQGLGGNWICWPLYAQEEVQVALNLPETWEPQALFFLGYTDEQPGEKALMPISEILKTL
jgi:nitroreductase